ncbi:MAG: thioredoxin family protein [Ignavibacterium sp.]
MNNNTIKTHDELIKLTEKFTAVCFYLSTPQCNVCKVLKPKVIELIENEFPQLKFFYIDLNDAKEITGQLSVFTVPTILVFFDGKELIRTSRNISLEQLKEQIKRYYQLIFSD